MSKQVTLIDIAKACGTSNVTVSKALTDKKGVSDELRQKIKDTAERMGYVPPRSAAKRRDNRMVGVLIPEKFMNPNGSFYWALYNSLVNTFKKHDYFCVIETLTEQEERSFTMPKFISDGKVTSLISLGQLDAEYVCRLKETGVPMVMLDYYIADSDVDAVVTNGYVGGYELASYLIKCGHTDIGFIGTVKATSSIFDRYMGYMKAMLENGLTVRSEWTLDDRNERDFIEIPFPDKLPTAFVCNCDEAAYHAIRQLEARGISVPDDISIVGYDNYLISEVCKPAITTIDVNSGLMAAKAVETLLERLENPDAPPQTVTISGELTEKDSVKSIFADQ
ncbi:MAG: LacI family DNA-binding transcriptional regulator [Oscillospiraceae bacterium]